MLPGTRLPGVEKRSDQQQEVGLTGRLFASSKEEKERVQVGIMAPWVLPVSMMAMNYALAATTAAIAVFALGLLVYAVFVRPEFAREAGQISEATAEFENVTPTRLTKNDLIQAVPDKEHVIDLKEMGLETNQIVDQGGRSDREIEANLHSEIEAAVEESSNITATTVLTTKKLTTPLQAAEFSTSNPSTSETSASTSSTTEAVAEFGPESPDAFDDTPDIASTSEPNPEVAAFQPTSTTTPTNPAPTAPFLEGRFVDESSTIEPPFDRVLAFPDCERTKDGRKFC